VIAHSMGKLSGLQHAQKDLLTASAWGPTGPGRTTRSAARAQTLKRRGRCPVAVRVIDRLILALAPMWSAREVNQCQHITLTSEAGWDYKRGRSTTFESICRAITYLFYFAE